MLELKRKFAKRVPTGAFRPVARGVEMEADLCSVWVSTRLSLEEASPA
jgi:hypothetical protein